jgi:hypothetical protein
MESSQKSAKKIRIEIKPQQTRGMTKEYKRREDENINFYHTQSKVQRVRYVRSEICIFVA